jgi:TetR/AcrR family transcriptional repressor of nem operon
MFAQRSYDGTSIDDLVNHLGVHRGSLYKTFGNKRGLYLTALRRHIDHDVTALAAAVSAGADADEVRQVLADGHDLGLLFLAMVERAPIDPEAAAETSRAMAMLDEANGAQRRTALALGLLLRARAAAAATQAAAATPVASAQIPAAQTSAAQTPAETGPAYAEAAAVPVG